MKNKNNSYECSNCGYITKTWSGKCYQCGQWSTLVEIRFNPESKSNPNSSGILPQVFNKIKDTAKKKKSVGLPYFDQVLGGGLISGSVILLGGEPGIGKSTLALQLLNHLSSSLYVCGEESASQIKERGRRLNLKNTQKLFLLEDVDVINVVSQIRAKSWDLVVIDSIQSIYHPDFPNTPGSPVQLRESALSLIKVARSTNVPIILIGQVTKEGTVAGPRLLEHMVDAMLYLEGERTFGLRMLRSVKNRFSQINSEIVKLTESGFCAEKNTAWLSEDYNQPGSSVTVTFIGKRPMVVEAQALVEPTIGNYPKRNALNFSISRLDQILAIINSHTNYKIYGSDVFLNISGGLSINDPGIDLAIACALISAKAGKRIKPNICLLGELTLTGQIREPVYLKERLMEAKKVGFTQTLNLRYIKEALSKIF